MRYFTREGFTAAGCFILFFSILALMLSGVQGDEQEAGRMSVEINIFSPTIKIEVPKNISLGNLTKGYSTDRFRVDINNTGTVAVRLTPRLAEGSDRVFRNLMFARRTTEQFATIGNFSINISKPSDMGRIETEYFYMRLDLSSYDGEIRNDRLGEKTDVIFWAIPQ